MQWWVSADIKNRNRKLTLKFAFPLTPVLKKLQLAAGICRPQITEVDQTIIMFKIILVMKNNKHHFYSDVVKK
jgi:hypothetical protein